MRVTGCKDIWRQAKDNVEEIGFDLKTDCAMICTKERTLMNGNYWYSSCLKHMDGQAELIL